MTTLSKKQVIKELWRRGELSWKLDDNQKELLKLYREREEKIQIWLLARRTGKSFMLLILALQECFSRANSIVSYLAPTKLQVNSIIRPLMVQIVADCPEEMRPKFNTKEYAYFFPNGSILRIAGADNNHAEKLRGLDCMLALVDEAGSIDDLDYIVRSIIRPTTMLTKGKIILASTPPKSADHEFLDFVEEAELNNTIVKKTIYDNPRLTTEEIEKEIEESGGRNSESVRRELFCEIVKSANLSVIPEFTDELEQKIVKKWEKPVHFDSYVGMDLGFKDLTVVLFGYYDFRASKLIIEDEIVVDFRQTDANIGTLTNLILNKEAELWTNPLTNEVQKPFVRVSDINPIVTREIHVGSGGQIHFRAAKKDDKDAAINNLRLLLSSEKIIINPKCEVLLNHLRNVKWKSELNKKDFGRSKDGGHYDGCDAMIYLTREVNFNKNPYPVGYDYNQKDLFVNNRDSFYENSYKSAFEKIYNKKLTKRNPFALPKGNKKVW